MKHLLVLFIGISLSFFTCCAQGYLGQTKEYVMSRYTEKYIIYNTVDSVAFQDDIGNSWFSFNKSTHLCDEYTLGMPLSFLDVFLEILTERGWSLPPLPSNAFDGSNMIKILCNGEAVCEIFSGGDDINAVFSFSFNCNQLPWH